MKAMESDKFRIEMFESSEVPTKYSVSEIGYADNKMALDDINDLDELIDLLRDFQNHI
jgi:hypothetical protein